jgi:integrase
MASIKRIEGKRGLSFEICVTHGRDANGKQKRHFMTWKPPGKMSEKRLNDEVQKAAFEFERRISEGYVVDNRQTFAEYSQYVLDSKRQSKRNNLRTLEYHQELLERRIIPAIGHLKLTDIRPQHLNAFYINLAEPGIREDGHRAIVKVDFAAVIKKKGLTQMALAQKANVSDATIKAIKQGRRVILESATKVATALGEQPETLFTLEYNKEPLSDKYIHEHHLIISKVLRQAEKEMIVPYNAAEKAEIPQVMRKEAESYQPEEIEAITLALEGETLKWKTYTHLLLISGGRRGEIAGLLWEKLDWQRSDMIIDQALLYSKKTGIYVSTTKTKKKRFVKLPAETMSLLHEYHMEYLDLQVKNGDRWQDTGFVFVQDNGEPMHPDSINSWLKKFAERHSLPKINPHKFRHSMASILYFSGVDPVSISKRLGHARVTTTQNFYAHYIEQGDESASEAMAEIIHRRKPKPAEQKIGTLRVVNG